MADDLCSESEWSWSHSAESCISVCSSYFVYTKKNNTVGVRNIQAKVLHTENRGPANCSGKIQV